MAQDDYYFINKISASLKSDEKRILIILREAHAGDDDTPEKVRQGSLDFYKRISDWANWESIAKKQGYDSLSKSAESKYHNRFLEMAKKVGIKGTEREIFSKIAVANISGFSGKEHIGENYHQIKDKINRIDNIIRDAQPDIVFLVCDLFDMMLDSMPQIKQCSSTVINLYGDKPNRKFYYGEFVYNSIRFVRTQHPSFSEKIHFENA